MYNVVELLHRCKFPFQILFDRHAAVYGCKIFCYNILRGSPVMLCTHQIHRWICEDTAAFKVFLTVFWPADISDEVVI